VAPFLFERENLTFNVEKHAFELHELINADWTATTEWIPRTCM